MHVASDDTLAAVCEWSPGGSGCSAGKLAAQQRRSRPSLPCTCMCTAGAAHGRLYLFVVVDYLPRKKKLLLHHIQPCEQLTDRVVHWNFYNEWVVFRT